MDIRKFILNRIGKKGRVTVAEVAKVLGFSRVYVHRFFQELSESGKLAKIGHANRSHYVLPAVGSIKKAKQGITKFSRVFNNKNLHEDEIIHLIKKETGIFERIKENAAHILEYAFTEMLNNAIEHSGSLKIKAIMERDGNIIKFQIIDWGVGIFEKIIHSRHLANSDEAIQDLLKGKQTTDPEAHSGEGIFFTRRAGDTFIIRSSTRKLFFNNPINDFAVVTIKPVLGTRITFTVAGNTKKKLQDVFSQYAGEAFEFGTTEVVVRLYEKGSPTFISRSQARRILYGLDKFKKIILDFDKVKSVGQGFADEVFRVWQVKNPHVTIIVKNAGSDADFMIKRYKNIE
ncbi:MAG: hypothetical protein A2659_01460 [Candidatus Yanofskybacteria bacterium RIFCSPHIGHO2_01_FULL_44_24]|nr:MAG: hypothetical protein A2659_01460 [Candidatus Yanofskybacteria bacterium RIFCSPHIGHO2_01_FULL_44_24]